VDITARIPLTLRSVQVTGPLPHDTVHLANIRLRSRPDSTPQPRPVAILGLPLGRGRIVALGDGQILANDFIRVCRWGAAVTVVRAIEWASARDGEAPRRMIVFDEYHHGYGQHANVLHAVWSWLGTTASGRTIAQLALAALLLLVAAAARPIAPLTKTTIPRRSPLEHVAALAQAYEQVKATRVATALLVKGVRRRVVRTVATRQTTDEQFLADVAVRHPSIQPDTARVHDALVRPIAPAELLEIAAGIDRIERSLRP
jgi:hypothetical protein